METETGGFSLNKAKIQGWLKRGKRVGTHTPTDLLCIDLHFPLHHRYECPGNCYGLERSVSSNFADRAHGCFLSACVWLGVALTLKADDTGLCGEEMSTTIKVTLTNPNLNQVVFLVS